MHLRRSLRMRDFSLHLSQPLLIQLGTAVAQWLRRCATNRTVAGSIPDGVTGIFH